MISFSILDVTIYVCIAAPVLALALATPALFLSSQLTTDNDKENRETQETSQRRKRSSQATRRGNRQSDIHEVERKVNQLLGEIELRQETGSQDKNLLAIKAELETIQTELRRRKQTSK